ncbi:hypothetical protein ACFX2J_027568 [Malus domestica]|uniref:transcription termination factor MTEF18, mitochondrial-like n=1 Tax=Malus domestica TaxID=3750 RepID=UPI0010AA48F9|nr:transcription termination factor MTEF18, mitochondrial-like [Malus domestica]
MSLPKCIYTLRLSHHFSTATKTASAVRLPKLSNVPTRYKSETIKQAQQALTDYLHATRSLSFPSAEHISKNCLFSLTNLIKKIEFSVPKFSNRFKRLLRYHPINEFEFFFESIGIDYNQVCDFLPPNKYFFSEDGTLLNVATELSRFGFPWNMLGKLYEEEISIFSESSEVLKARLSRLKECGFSNHSVVGMCLAFPYLLAVEGEPGGDAALFDDFKRVLVEFNMEYCVEGNVDAWYDVCKKVRVFCDLGCGKGKIGELMGRKKDVFLTCPAEVLCQKSRYFCRFGVRKEDVGLFLLQSPEVLNFDLETPNISALGLLEIFGLNVKEIEAVIEKYPHVMGKNKMANLPHVIRALDLHEWFFTKIKNEPQLLENYVISDFDEDIAKEFGEGLERIQSTTTPIHTMRKLDFMHSIGFGENTLTLKVLAHLHGRSGELQKRFDSLFSTGIDFSRLCLMISTTPKILNQNPESLEAKVNFLCKEMKSSLEYLNIFPAFLCFDLENRVKPRYRFYVWLKEKGLHSESYSIATMIATSEKQFVARAFGIHPAAPKHWFERFSYRRSFKNCAGTSIP